MVVGKVALQQKASFLAGCVSQTTKRGGEERELEFAYTLSSIYV